MKATDAQRNLSLYGGSTATWAESIATELRKAGLLPKGGRGNHAPSIDVAQAALFALVVAGAKTAATALDAALQIHKMHNAGGERLIDALARHFAGKCSRDILAVRVLVEAGGAEIWLRTADDEALVEHFALPDMWQKPDFKPQFMGAGYAGRIGHIGSGVIKQFRLDFTDGYSPAGSFGWEDEGELVSE
jgi:hypothetical protein